MMRFLEDLASRQRFGMKPGLETISALCKALGDPQLRVAAVHIAGTNGKGALAAMLDACLREGSLRVGRYTSPHLVSLNERFFLDGRPVEDETLDKIASEIWNLEGRTSSSPLNMTFFEALTAVAFVLYDQANVDYAVLETGLGGRLDATNVCSPVLTVITKVGLDHCDWLGSTVEAIAAEKAGIVKAGVPVILGKNDFSVRQVVEEIAKKVGAPFFYAPEIAPNEEIPADLALDGAFNRENAQTLVAAIKILSRLDSRVTMKCLSGLSKVVWPGRFQCVGSYIVDGAHNPPAARALASALVDATSRLSAVSDGCDLIFGACGDKDVDEVLSILKPLVKRGFAVRTNNPRSLSPEVLADKMNILGIPTTACASLSEALAQTSSAPLTLICGSLFLAGEALVALKAYPWASVRFDPSEKLKA